MVQNRIYLTAIQKSTAVCLRYRKNLLGIPDEVIRRLKSLPTGTVEHVVIKLNIGRNILEIIDMKGSFVCEIFFDVEVTVEIKEYLPNEVLKYSENKDTLSEIIRFNLEVDGENVDVDIIRNPKGFNFTTSKPANFSVTLKSSNPPQIL